MRAHRTRFRTPKTRVDPLASRAMATVEGVSRFKKSPRGQNAKITYIQSQWQSQRGLCAICEEELALGDAVLKLGEFPKGTIVPVVHNRCKRRWARQANTTSMEGAHETS